jgi:hypothetical protein
MRLRALSGWDNLKVEQRCVQGVFDGIWKTEFHTEPEIYIREDGGRPPVVLKDQCHDFVVPPVVRAITVQMGAMLLHTGPEIRDFSGKQRSLGNLGLACGGFCGLSSGLGGDAADPRKNDGQPGQNHSEESRWIIGGSPPERLWRAYLFEAFFGLFLVLFGPSGLLIEPKPHSDPNQRR